MQSMITVPFYKEESRDFLPKAIMLGMVKQQSDSGA